MSRGSSSVFHALSNAIHHKNNHLAFSARLTRLMCRKLAKSFVSGHFRDVPFSGMGFSPVFPISHAVFPPVPVNRILAAWLA
jgi:hypothetical protein